MIKLVKTQEKRPAERNHDLLLITGDGKSLPDDLERFLSLEYAHDVMCIGRSIKRYPANVTHYADVDADAGKWVVENLAKVHPHAGQPVTHTLGNVEWFDVGWDTDDSPFPMEDVRWYGSTGLFAVLIAKEMGYGMVVLAGCPMDRAGHWYYPEQTHGPRWDWEDLAAWIEFSVNGSEGVYSMSGYTKMLLGGALPWDL